MRKNLLALFLMTTFLLPSASFAQTTVKITPAERKMADEITANQLRDYLYYVASDEMEGRDTPSRGLDLTAKFIGTMLARWGFKPAGDDGTFYQKIELNRAAINPTATTVTINGQNLAYGTDFIANPTAGTISNAPLVFGGNGWMIKSKNLDPLKGVDARGKAVVIYSDNLPRGMTFQELFASGKQGEDWADPATYAKQNGAVGLIFVGTPNVMKNWETLRRQRERSNFTVGKLRQQTSAQNFPVVYISSQAAENLFNGETTNFQQVNTAYGANGAMPTFGFNSSKTASVTVAAQPDTAMTQNVVALWEGSDPTLKAEMVAIGAHYDHDGVRPNAPGPDKIWNGADDDGSGTVAVLSIAEALAKAKTRPKRSILFVWHAGEEKGLWGSEYFNKFPTVDIKNVVAQLNIDMIGRSKKPGDANPKNKDLSGENGIYVIGSEMMSSTLGAITKQTNAGFLNLGYDYRYDDPKDTNRFFFRSDHFNYAVNGIPIVFWFDGVHEDYHQASDSADKIDYAKMEKITRTIFMTLWEITDLKQRPAVDKQLPPELNQR
ncbi:MAG TPA: M28 family peptidase [Pyrinomonadaceae bacterium]